MKSTKWIVLVGLVCMQAVSGAVYAQGLVGCWKMDGDRVEASVGIGFRNDLNALIALVDGQSENTIFGEMWSVANQTPARREALFVDLKNTFSLKINQESLIGTLSFTTEGGKKFSWQNLKCRFYPSTPERVQPVRGVDFPEEFANKASFIEFVQLQEAGTLQFVKKGGFSVPTEFESYDAYMTYLMKIREGTYTQEQIQKWLGDNSVS
jgi:hypothetical protein